MQNRSHLKLDNVGYILWCEDYLKKGTKKVMHEEIGRWCSRIICGEHMNALLCGKNSNLIKGEEVELGYRCQKSIKRKWPRQPF